MRTLGKRASGVALTVTVALTGAGATFAAEVIDPSEVSFTDMGGITDSLSGSPGDVENGKILMNKGAGNCIACHQVTALSDLPFHGEVGPSLDGVATRWDEPQLRGIVANAKQTFPGTIMPAFYHTGPYERPGDAYTGNAAEGDLDPILTAQEVEDLVAFLKTLDTYPD